VERTVHRDAAGTNLDRSISHIAGHASESGSLPLRVNFSWTLTGSIVYGACQWGVLIVLARLGSPEVVGRFALALAVTAPVLMLTNLHLRAVQATDARRLYAFSEYLGLRVVSNIAALVIVAGIVLVVDYAREVTLVVAAVAVAKVIESTSDVFHGLLQQRERMDRIAKSRIMRGSLSLLAIAVVYWASGSLPMAVGAFALVWLVVLVTYDLRSGALILDRTPSGPWGAKLRPAFDPARLWRLAWLAAPLGFVMLLISLTTNIPRYFLEHHVGTRELGVFAAMSYLVIAGSMVVNALGQAASPRLAKLYSAGSRAGFVQLLSRLVAVGVVVGVAGIVGSLVAGRLVLDLLYGSEYAARSDVFVLVMVAGAVLYTASLLGYGMTAARKFRSQAPLFLVVTAVIVIACMTLIPQFQLRGAAVALIAGAVVQLAGSLIIIVHALVSLTPRSGVSP
jgi:O-antigen/teichoic acid export membrane protein